MDCFLGKPALRSPPVPQLEIEKAGNPGVNSSHEQTLLWTTTTLESVWAPTRLCHARSTSCPDTSKHAIIDVGLTYKSQAWPDWQFMMRAGLCWRRTVFLHTKSSLRMLRPLDERPAEETCLDHTSGEVPIVGCETHAPAFCLAPPQIYLASLCATKALHAHGPAENQRPKGRPIATKRTAEVLVTPHEDAAHLCRKTNLKTYVGCLTANASSPIET